MNNKKIIFIDFDKVSFETVRLCLPDYVETYLFEGESEVIDLLKNEKADLILIELLIEEKEPFKFVENLAKIDFKNIIIISRELNNPRIKQKITEICPQAILIGLDNESIVNNINKILKLV